MPNIFDNIENYLLDGLKKTIEISYKADFCVGYFNLRGWKHLSGLIEKYEGTEITLHPEFLKKEGRNEFVVLPYNVLVQGCY